MNYEELINKIKLRMKVLGVKQGKIAKSIGINRSVFSRKINGQNNFTGEELFKLLFVLGFEIKETVIVTG